MVRRRTLAKILRYTTCLVIVLSLTIAMRGVASTDAPDPALRDAVEELRNLYSTEVTLGKPLEIDAFKIIPLATVGIGYGQRMTAPGAEALRGAGVWPRHRDPAEPPVGETRAGCTALRCLWKRLEEMACVMTQ